MSDNGFSFNVGDTKSPSVYRKMAYFTCYKCVFFGHVLGECVFLGRCVSFGCICTKDIDPKNTYTQ